MDRMVRMVRMVSSETRIEWSEYCLRSHPKNGSNGSNRYIIHVSDSDTLPKMDRIVDRKANVGIRLSITRLSNQCIRIRPGCGTFYVHLKHQGAEKGS